MSFLIFKNIVIYCLRTPYSMVWLYSSMFPNTCKIHFPPTYLPSFMFFLSIKKGKKPKHNKNTKITGPICVGQLLLSMKPDLGCGLMFLVSMHWRELIFLCHKLSTPSSFLAWHICVYFPSSILILSGLNCIGLAHIKSLCQFMCASLLLCLEDNVFKKIFSISGSYNLFAPPSSA